MADQNYSADDLKDLRDLWETRDDPSLTPTQKIRILAIGQKQGWDKPAKSKPEPGWLEKLASTMGQGASYVGRGVGRFGQALAEDASNTSDVVKQGLGDLMGASNPISGLSNLFTHTISPVVQGMGQGVLEQEKQAGQDFSNGNPLLGVMRGAIGAVPGVGSQFMRGVDRFGSGDPAGGLSDFAQVGLMADGPEVLSKPQGLTRTLGEKMVKSAQGDLADVAGRGLDKGGLDVVSRLDPNTYSPIPGPTPREQVVGQIEKMGVYPKRGSEAIGDVAATQKAIDYAKQQRNQQLAGVTTPVKAAEVVDPAYNYVKTLRDENEPAHAQAEKYLADKVQKYTQIPVKVDAEGKPIESNWQYINRALIEDKGKLPTDWQKEKDTLRKFQSEMESQKSQGEVMETRLGSDQNLRDLMIHGISQGLNKYAGPEIGDFNREIHQTIAIQDGIKDMAKSDPKTLNQAMQYVLGGAATGAVGAATAMGGHIPIGAGAASVGGGILAASAVFARKLATDPVARARFGDFLRQHSNSQVIPQTFGNVPKLRILATSPQGGPNQQ